MFPSQYFAPVFFAPVYWQRPRSSPPTPVYAGGLSLLSNSFCRVIVRINRQRR